MWEGLADHDFGTTDGVLTHSAMRRLRGDGAARCVSS